MPTECSRDLFGYEVVEGRQVVAAFDGGEVTSDAGALLLGATDRAIGLVTRFAACFDDGRVQTQVEHTVEAMVAQRVFGIALGYEDLVDHDQLRHDPVLATLAGKLTARRQGRAPLAGKRTLNRLEHAPLVPSRYHKIGHDAAAIEGLFVALFLEAHKTPPARIVLDLDATDDPLHGHQEGRFFHGYYDCFCYLPLYIFCGRHLLAAKLRRSNIDASAGALDELERIVGQIRARWPRGPSGRLSIRPRPQRAPGRRDHRTARRGRGREPGSESARPALRRLRLAHAGQLEPHTAGRRQGRAPAQGLEPALRRDLAQRHRHRRSDPLRAGLLRPRRGRKPDQRTATRPVRRSHVRSDHARQPAQALVASFAYVLIEALRRIGLRFTQFATATCATIRLKLLKIGAQVRHSVRRIKIAMASACPFQTEYHLAYLYLKRAAAF